MRCACMYRPRAAHMLWPCQAPLGAPRHVTSRPDARALVHLPLVAAYEAAHGAVRPAAAVPRRVALAAALQAQHGLPRVQVLTAERVRGQLGRTCSDAAAGSHGMEWNGMAAIESVCAELR